MADGQKPAYGCQIAPTVPLGTLLKDTRLRNWTVGKSVGSGGFGAIYLCDIGCKDHVGNDAEYVVKIEPHSNGPLFVEMHVFLRLGLEEHMVSWQPRHPKKPKGWVGIPKFYGSGSVTVENQKLRFVVMTRFGSDLEKFFKSGSKPLPIATVLNIAVQVINSLEYIHSKNYTHNDVKAQNLLLDEGGCDVYLVDFGLACKFKDNFGFHCDGDGDERKAHEGTLEYTSRDAHRGAHSRRGDLETLGYNMVHWASGFLPWKETENAEHVQAQKNGFLGNIDMFLTKCFKPESYPVVFKEYFDCICKLEFKTKPDYNSLRGILGKALTGLGSVTHDTLRFGKKTKIRKSRKSDVFPILNQEEGRYRSTRSQDDSEKVFWQDVLDPESIIKSASRSNFDDESNETDLVKEAAEQKRQEEALVNPTPEMTKLLDIRRIHEEERVKLSWKDQLAEMNKRNATNKLKFSNMDLTPRYNTPVMEEVIALRAERLAMHHHTPDTSDDENVFEETPSTVIETRQNRRIAAPSSSDKTSRKGSSQGVINQLYANCNTPKLKTKDTLSVNSGIETRARKKSKALSVSQQETPSCLPTPSTTAPSTPTPTIKNRRIKNKCLVCSKLMLESSLDRHYNSVHSMKRPHRATTECHSGLTPELKRGRPSNGERFSCPLEKEIEEIKEDSLVSKIIPMRRRALLDDKLNPLDSPSKNLRMVPCPICGIEITMCSVPKHCQDYHSPKSTRRTKKNIDLVTGAFAKVKVSTSTSTPEKIRDFDSPSRPDITKEAVGNIVSTFRRGLVL